MVAELGMRKVSTDRVYQCGYGETVFLMAIGFSVITAITPMVITVNVLIRKALNLVS
jgi:hypothetical protein